MRYLLPTLACLVLATSATAFERYYVLKVSGYDGSKTLQVMSKDELKEFDKLLRTESRLISKAERAAEQEWESADEDRISFPSFKPRRYSRAGTYETKDEAQEKITDTKARRAEKAAEDKKKKKPSYGKKLTKEDLAEEKLKAARIESQEKMAYDIFLRHLNELLKESGEEPNVFAAASTTASSKGGVKDMKGPEVKAVLTGELKKAGKEFYVSVDEGQTIDGLIPWGISIPLKKVNDKTVTEEMVGKKVKIDFVGNGKARKPNIKVTISELKSITVLDPAE